MDKATLLSDIFQRNALRREAQLPLLDVREELRKACDVERLREWHTFIESKQTDYNRIREEVIADLRAELGPQFPSNSIAAMAIGLETDERFEAFAEIQYGVKAPNFDHE